MFIHGKAKIFDFIDILKENCIKAGWNLKKEKVLKFDKIYNTINFKLSSENLTDDLFHTSESFLFVTLPRKAKAKELIFNGEGAKVSVYGVLQDNTEEIIFKDATTSPQKLDTKKQYARYKIISDVEIKEANLTFETGLNLQKEIYLQSFGSSEKEEICVNFGAYLMPVDFSNLQCNVASGFSNELDFFNQNNGINSVMGCGEEFDYFLNIDKNRIILVMKISEENASLYEIGYFGKLRLYGGEWSVTTNFANIAPSYNAQKKFLDIDKSCIENPEILYANTRYSLTENNTNISGPSGLDLAPFNNGDVYCVPIFYYKKREGDRLNGIFFGEVDGIIKIVTAKGLNSEDEINIDGKNYIVFQNGKSAGAYNLFAVLKE